MKNKILISLLTLGIAIAAYAASDDVIRVISVNGDKTEYKTSEIKEVAFSGDQMVIIDNHGAKEYNVADVAQVKRPKGVNLGLSVRWAEMNVGAEHPSDYGDYFAWGETVTKSNYTSDNSKWYGSKFWTLTQEGYDAATANWGSEWRMPTIYEISELLNKCTWTWTTLDGHNGYKVTGPNGNSIFLPAAGCRSDNRLEYDGSIGYYWSRSLVDTDDKFYACNLYFRRSEHISENSYRYLGMTVRPVTK